MISRRKRVPWHYRVLAALRRRYVWWRNKGKAGK